MQGGIALTGMAAAAQLTAQKGAISAKKSLLRGLMVDAARVPEPLEYYRRVIDFCAQWELNALQFRIADDQGSALRFSSVPDLLFHQHAVTPEQMKELVHYGQGRGVELIPELESFGHTGYITRSKAYAHLLDDDPKLPAEFTGVIPVAPETLALFKKLYAEIAAIFSSSYLHGGCDEVNWGGSALSRKALETKQRYQIWAEYLNSLNEIAEGAGKQFIVWGDIVVRKEPRILEQLNKRIVVMDWAYTETSTEKIASALAMVRKNGSRGIGAPALINWRWGARAGKDQLANIDAFADAYMPGEEAGSLGVIVTNWVPCRYIQNAIWDGFAYGAVALKEGSKRAQQSGLRRFVKTNYEAVWSDGWDEAFRLIYDNAPQMQERTSAAGVVPLHVPWSSDEELSAALKDRSPRTNPFTRLRTLVGQLQGKVQRNQADFRAFALTVHYLEHVYWREEMVAGKAGTREDAARVMREIAERDRTLAEALSKEWDQGRFPDSAAKVKPLFGMQPKDQLVFAFERAADYSASLAAYPDRFVQLIALAKQG